LRITGEDELEQGAEGEEDGDADSEVDDGEVA
jgi:hypothetical protein